MFCGHAKLLTDTKKGDQEMTWAEWKEAFLLLGLIAAGVAAFGILIWRIAKHDEQERREREEGSTTSKYSGSAH